MSICSVFNVHAPKQNCAAPNSAAVGVKGIWNVSILQHFLHMIWILIRHMMIVKDLLKRILAEFNKTLNKLATLIALAIESTITLFLIYFMLMKISSCFGGHVGYGFRTIMQRNQ